MNHQEIFEQYHAEHLKAFQALKEHARELEAIAKLCTEAIVSGHKLLVCGNGGSAADAQHFAAELTGRYRRERHPLPALALTTDTSALTCIGNDYAFEELFSRQVLALGQKGDVLVGISTSGTSQNVLKAMEAAREKGLKTVLLTGARPTGEIPNTDLVLRVPSTTTAHIQEMHIFCIHVICETIDEAVLEPENA